jgi:hypothetical protein
MFQVCNSTSQCPLGHSRFAGTTRLNSTSSNNFDCQTCALGHRKNGGSISCQRRLSNFALSYVQNPCTQELELSAGGRILDLCVRPSATSWKETRLASEYSDCLELQNHIFDCRLKTAIAPRRVRYCTFPSAPRCRHNQSCRAASQRTATQSGAWICVLSNRIATLFHPLLTRYTAATFKFVSPSQVHHASVAGQSGRGIAKLPC